MSKKDFDLLRSGTKQRHFDWARIVYKKGIDSSKIAVVLSKKIEKSAVKRNAIKRRVYRAVKDDFENFALENKIFFVLYPKKEIKNTSGEEIESSIKDFFKTLR